MLCPVLPKLAGTANPRPSMVVMPRDKPSAERCAGNQVISTREVRVPPSGSKRGSDVVENSGIRTCVVTGTGASSCAQALTPQRQGAMVANTKGHGLAIEFNHCIRHTTTALMTPPNCSLDSRPAVCGSLSDGHHDWSPPPGGAGRW